MNDLLGYSWLAERYQITPCQPLQVVSLIDSRRQDVEINGVINQSFPPSYRIEPTLDAHLTFAFKREALHLEFLARLFQAIDAADLVNWITAEPTSQYARKACFFYEWLTGRSLDHPGLNRGNYVDAINGDQYLTCTQPTRNTRWRVLDNLPGTPDFCPMVRLTPTLNALIDYDPGAALDQLGVEYGEDTLIRSAVWLTIKESKSSFAIEHEQQQVDRIQRFAAVMELRCGNGKPPLAPQQLTDLQSAILGPKALSYGMRSSPVFVGQTVGFQNVVNYLAPHWEQASGMLQGLQQFEQRTAGRNSILRATCLSFGFVYIHPLGDGNGRVSRFLINDTLRRDKVVPAPYILPVSATMQNARFLPQNYDQILDEFSRPLMNNIRPDLHFDQRQVYADGVESNLRFDGFDTVAPAWRYIDMTKHAEYIARVIRHTIEEEMRSEALILRDHLRAREAIKEILEGPDQDIDRIIRSIHQSKGVVSGKLRKQYPQLLDETLSGEIVRVVREHLSWSQG